MNLSGGEITQLSIAFIYLIVVGFGLWLAFTLISAIVRISHAFASASRSLETITAKYKATPPQG